MAVQFRLLGLDVDDAGGGVLAEQGALGTAQHLDGGDVEGLQHLRLGGHHHEVIHRNAHRRLDVEDDAVLAHTPQAGVEGVEGRRVAGNQVRHRGGHVADVPHQHLVQVFVVKRRHRDRRDLDVGLTTAGGRDQNLFELRLAQRGHWRQRQQAQGRDSQGNALDSGC